MTTYGRTQTATTGMPVEVLADGSHIGWKSGGITIDWSTVPAVAADTTLADGNVIKAGQKGLMYGTVLCKITASGKYGPWSPPMTSTTLNGATVIGATSAVLASAANIVPGDVLQIDTAGNLENAQVAAVSGSTVTFAAPLTKAHADGVAVAKPSDGRQALARGDCWVLNQTVLQNPPNSLAVLATDNPPVFNAGRVFFDRLQVAGTGAPASPLGAAGQPSRSAFEAAFPMIDYVQATS